MVEGEVLKIGDTVKIINHKFPELNPKGIENKIMILSPERLNEVYRKFKKPEDADLTFAKDISFKYQLKGINCLGLTGEIIEIRSVPETEYEMRTGDIAKYVIRFTTNHVSWRGKKMTLFPSQVERIKEGNQATQMRTFESQNY